MPPLRVCRLLLLFLFIDNVRKTLAKSIPDKGSLEVLIRVQVFDNSDLSPLADATVEVYGNQSTLATRKADKDGVVTVTFQYHPGTWVIVTASKIGYVTNSAPWHAVRIPLYASVSLYLLPERPATLILYDDVVQVLSGSPGARNQPWVQFQRKAINLPSNSSHTELWAVLTTGRSQYEIRAFPYMLGVDGNHTGGVGTWLELTPLASVSTHLFAHNGSPVRVLEPIHVSVPLPSDSLLRMATSVPVWRFESSTDEPLNKENVERSEV